MRRGFTLIETLMVIATIGVVLSLLVPALGRVRSVVNRTECLANLRGLGMGLRLYMDSENDGILPAAPSYWESRPRDYRNFDKVFHVIEPYVDAPPPITDADPIRTDSPWACPADESFKPVLGYSYDYLAGRFMSDDLTGLLDPALARPVTLVYEGGFSPYFDIVILDINECAHLDIAPPGILGENALFIDGHADWTMEQILYLPDGPDFVCRPRGMDPDPVSRR